MAIVVIGNFDGVHLGHKRVVEHAVRLAEKRSQTVTALTFDVHPKTFFSPDSPVRRILTDEKKKALLLSFGADRVVFQRFDRAMADMSAEAYLTYVKQQYDTDTLVCGENFRLGKNASAGITELCEIAGRLGMTVEAVPLSYLENGLPISSSNVRSAVENGDMDLAGEMLGRRFSLSGQIVRGRAIGRTISLPTANLLLDEDMLLPKPGVYATYAYVDGVRWKALTNVGTNPTVTDSDRIVVETHLTECDGQMPCPDLYGKTLTVVFLRFVREEQRFGDLDELKRQITTDIQKSDVIFRNYADKIVIF